MVFAFLISLFFIYFILFYLQTLEMKKVAKSYNKMAAVLLEFELIYYRAWCRFADQARNALYAFLLVRHPETNVSRIYFVLLLHCLVVPMILHSYHAKMSTALK